jgi:Kae1-associated kinase Bud32
VVDVNDLIHVGAEAELRHESYLGRPVVAKRRLAKAYRHPQLDGRLRRERTKLEAALLAQARLAGVQVPTVVDVDLVSAVLRMSLVGGRRLRDVIDEEPARRLEWARRFGAEIGRLHQAGIVHGDPTTSNAHVDGDRLVLLDFGLSSRNVEVEDQGVDLHLVERTFESSHAAKDGLFDAFLQGYRSTFPHAKAVERRMHDIKARARYV